MQCDKCGTPFKHGDRQSVVVVEGGVPMHQLCHDCHVFKHELMDDPNLENKLCAFCAAMTPASSEGPERLAQMFRLGDGS